MWGNAIRRQGWAVVLAASAAWGGIACTEKEAASPTGSGTAVAAASAGGGEALTPAVRKEAEEVFNSRCSVCHGPRGAGDGPASKGLTPPPRNFQDTDWQGEVSDEHIEKIIAYGGGAVGRSPAMPPNPDLADKPVVRGLREHIRGLAAK
ncbi:cytochrome c [Pyxidicoccus fallax]|uniref:Cytochrome c n=1 Tax=Pyxidicoccus fallax TaxID=394095 RepID=A0A848L769_9BACT|nr:cytochrome c [Pyxidicoccus fallax]NMO14830.1 cytochrome c [Pyxidicoccus fallax]NPC76779.1 cytochrome c [Pyxidicoccus fallax]